MDKFKNPVVTLNDIDENINEASINYLKNKIDENSGEESNNYREEEKVFFAFIDVLGFKQTFDEFNMSENNKKNLIDKFSDVFCYYFDLLYATGYFAKSKDYYAGQTSDSLYFYTIRSDFLFGFIKILSYLNLYAMTKNVFFRGGIACGNLYIKEPYQFYGNSVIKSYLLESLISKNPIITVDENTYKEMVKFEGAQKFFSENGKNKRKYLKIFNWLSERYKLDIDHTSTIKLREIKDEDIIKNIKYNMKKFEYDDKNYSKFSFLLDEFYQYEADMYIKNKNDIK